MRLTDREHRPECHVIPFQPPQTQSEEVATSSIAAVFAVTVLHSSDESPEDRLVTILEQSGEVEVLDADEALDAWEVYYEDQMTPPANDNTHMGVI